MIARKILNMTAALAFWAPVIFFSVLLSHNAILYFTHGGEYGILPEKLTARQDIVWNIAFYIHLPTGIFCLLTPFFLFAFRYFRYPVKWHRSIGKLFVWVTIAIVCPTGMYLALYAKGGLITQVGFMIQGILLGWFSWRGYVAIQGGKTSVHLQHMIRAYAVATVVLSFRIYHILFFFLNVPYQDNYAISQWLGLSGNLLIAEFIIVYISTQKKIHLNPSSYEIA
jgi:hypothetical protein